MKVNVYSTSLLKHINTELIHKRSPNIKLDTKTCYTLREQDAFKKDQGKALETVVAADVKKTNVDLVILESGVNEVTKISRRGLPLKAMQVMLRNRTAAFVEFAEQIINTTHCKNVALIKMMLRFDNNVSSENARHFLQQSHQVWNEAMQEIIS